MWTHFYYLKLNKQTNSLQACNCHSLCSVESTQAPPTLQSGSGTEPGLEEAMGEWSPAWNQGDRECSRIATAGGCAGGTSVVAEPSAWGQPTTAAPPHELRAHMVPSCSSIAPLWGKGTSWERKECTLKGNQASLDPTTRASAPSVWIQPHPQHGSDSQRVEEEVSPDTCLWHKLLHLQLHFPQRWQLPAHLGEKWDFLFTKGNRHLKTT